MQIPFCTRHSFQQRFPRGVPARLLQAAGSVAVINFCVESDLNPPQENFLRRLAESGFKIPWYKVTVTQVQKLETQIPTVLFGCDHNKVLESGVLQTYSIAELIRDVKKKREFWEIAKVNFKEIISS